MKNFDCPSGVKFHCIKCGMCCGDTESKTRHVLALRSEVEKIANSTQRDILEFSQRVSNCLPYEHELKKTNGKCIFLKENLCTIYLIRPLICRFYPFELLPSQDSMHKFNYTAECPGIGMGEELGLTYFRRLFRLARARLGLVGASGSC